MRIRYLLTLIVLLCTSLRAQERTPVLPQRNAPNATKLKSGLYTPENEFVIPFFYRKDDAFQFLETPTLAERLFTARMLAEAVRLDPNRSIPLYRTDPGYSRVNAMALSGDGNLFGGADSPFSAILHQALSYGYMYLRERATAQHLSKIDYLQLPLNTGQLRTSQDVLDEARRRGDPK